MQFDLNLTTIVFTILSVLIGFTIHEAMHAYTGYALGDTTAQDEGRISLNPLRHIDPFATLILPVVTLLIFHIPILAAKPVPFNPARVKYDEFGAALIALAGPVSNLVLAVISGTLLRIVGTEGLIFDGLYVFTVINVGLFVFNMVPIPPLDGSRVLYAFAPDTVRDLMAQLETIGLFLIFGLVFLVPAFSDALFNINRAILHVIT